MPKIARLYDAFCEVFEQEASPVEGQSLQRKQEREKKERQKKNFKNPKRCRSLSHPKTLQILISVHAWAKMS